MKCDYACGSAEHTIARRQFLGSLAAGAGAVAGGLGAFAAPPVSASLAKNQKRMVVFNMHGGLSQLESWDPKPGTDTGGPFRAIPTSVPGIHISELLPFTAKQMHHLALVRGINTKNDDHGKGTYMMLTGRRQVPGQEFPQIGAVVAKCFDGPHQSLPGHVRITAGGGGRSGDSAYLGPKYASIGLDGSQPPANTTKPDSLSVASLAEQNEFRRVANDHFLSRRRTAMTDAYTQSYEQALELMKQRDVFDLSKEPEKDHERYGKHDFGRHCLMARRLLEKGITFAQVSHSNYDTHNENFNFHFEQMGEFDKPFATFVADLADRGMLDSTLIVVLSEFGRTPRINQYYGRDHWGRAWSVCVGGAGIVRGASVGATNKNGTEVSEREVDCGHLFHTYLRALGLSSKGNFDIAGRQVPMADPAVGPIKELLV
ncbi:MAG: DUF1501 domain-containing protein [Verrucomicrobia bacterium]|nr:DUF1501 domain-containing protein [Verrucomicrobiota bacterium]